MTEYFFEYVAQLKHLRKKEQTRVRQVRYRLRQAQYEDSLLSAIAKTATEIGELQTQCFRLRANLLGPVQVAESYLHCFRSGFKLESLSPWHPMHPPTIDNENDASALTRYIHIPEVEQVRFLKAMLHPDIVYDDLYGFNALLEQWRRYSTFFGSFTIQPHPTYELSYCADRTICRICCKMAMTITADTFQCVLPHLAGRSVIVAKLLGKQLIVDAMFLLEFDDKSNIRSHDWLVNFVDAFRLLLDSYEEVTTVLSQANITMSGQLGQDVVAKSSSSQLALKYILNPMPD